MTYAEVLTEARRLARTSTQGLSDASALAVVTKAIRRFCMDIGGYRYERKLEMKGTFIPETFEGFHLEIVGSSNNDIDSDIAVTSTGGGRITGAAMATELQSQIRTAIGAGSDLTVAYTNFYFTVDGIDSTTIEITAPTATATYLDATAKLFGGLHDGTTSITGDFPQGCTTAATAPTGLRTIQNIVWDRFPLKEAAPVHFLDLQATGTPAYYYQDNWGYILLYPITTEQKDLTVSYEGIPELTASPATSTTLPTEIPVEYQDAICIKVAEEMLLGAFDDTYADRRRYEYNEYVKRYKVQKANRNTEARQGVGVNVLPYYVEGV